MSMPVVRGPASPLQATRQQLDELDALIERMLALPVNQLPEELEPGEQLAASAEPAATPPPVVAANPFAIRDPDPSGASESLPSEEWVLEERERLPSPTEGAPDTYPFLEELPEHPAASPSSGKGLQEHHYPSPAKQEGLQERPPAKPNPAPELSDEEFVARWLIPLVGVNRAFDGASLWLGPPGRWLRGSWGRGILGGAGLILLAAAVAWGVLDWLGWLQQGLPVK
jgi:hypothetical protein